MIQVRGRSVSLVLMALTVVALWSGCRPSPDSATTPEAPSASSPDNDGSARSADRSDSGSLTANQVLQQLLKTYRSASTYSDDGVVRLRFVQQGQVYGDQWPSAVKFVRPNKLALRAFQATVVSDGQTLRATIEDPLTSNVDGQIVERPAPPQFKLTDLASDPLLYDVLSSKLRRQPIQLELLLESSGLASAFTGEVECRLLDKGTFDDRSCYRVEVPSPGGAFVFWVDEESSLLRKLEYPAAALVPELANDPSVSELSLAAELRGATIGERISDLEFTLGVPADAKLVRTFVVPPRPLPSKLFGQRPAKFYFTDLEGNRVGPEQWEDKIVLLTWYHDNPACEATLQQVSEAAKKLSGQDDVLFLAVATDPTSASTAELERRLESWNVNLPIVRDLEAFGDKVFKIEMQPTLVALDKDGRVQIFQMGGNPQLAGQIEVIVERLLQGDDLAGTIVAQATQERSEYDKLVAEGGPEPTAVVEIPEAVIRKRSEPRQISLKKIWENRELKSPGNLYVVEGDDPAIYAIEGWRNVVRLDSQGTIAKRHELPLPEGMAITFLRTATDAQGKRWFAAAAPLAPELFVFDDQFGLQAEYPSGNDDPLQIVDMQLADLDAKVPGLEVVTANVNLIGVHAASLEGNLLWRNRKFPNVTSITVTRPNDVGSFGLLVTGESGALLPINRYGNEDVEIAVKDRPIVRLFGAQFPSPTQSHYLGVSANSQGKAVVVGLDDAFRERWAYELPPGVHQRPIEPIVSSHLLASGAGEWWLAGPDGSIHLIREDGELHDSFYYGAVLTGIAAGRLGDKPLLIVATDEGVTAWEVALASGGR